MKNIAGAITAVFVIILLSMTAGTVGATNTKLTEPEMGKTYTLYNETSPTWTNVWVYVKAGDNVSVNLDWINGSTAPTMWIRPDGYCAGIYLSSSNDTLTNSCKLVMTEDVAYWYISAKESALMYSFDMPVGTALNYTFSRINNTVPNHTHQEFNSLASIVSNITNVTNALVDKVIDLNDTLNNLAESMDALKGNVTGTETELKQLIEKYNEILKNITELQKQIDALDIPEEANLTEVYNNISTLDLTCSYISQNISELSKLENLTNNITNNITMQEYNNESTVQVIIGIDANTTDALNATIDDVENLTGKINETVAGLSGVDKKVSDVANKSASKSSIKDISTTQVPMAIVMLCLLLMIGIIAVSNYRNGKRIDELVLQDIMDEEDAEKILKAGTIPPEDSMRYIAEVTEVMPPPKEPKEEEKKPVKVSTAKDEDELDEQIKKIMGD